MPNNRRLRDGQAGPVGEAIVWRSAAASHTGYVRKVNEDRFLNVPEHGLWAVADGMGGHSAGDFAAENIVAKLAEVTSPTDLSAHGDWVRARLDEVNRHLRDEASRRGQIIGSTVVVLQAVGASCRYAWVGDSRIYRLRGAELRQLTTDHTLVENLVQQGVITRDEAVVHPAANVITRAVGAEDSLDLAAGAEAVEQGDTFLLCSDGLCKELTDGEIVELLRAHIEPQEAVRRLVERALENGGSDNVTVCVVRAVAAK